MHTLPQEHHPQSLKESEPEGLVVLDQKGLVVLWPDGHCRRFPWAALRQACLCAECRKQHEEQKANREGSSASQPVSQSFANHH
ncbi:MAG: DUF971 domain-containing protein [Deltaproteobacteria bacterium]|nr:DUF971 domain-containing protein [Deltaproteobacteria bacterium]